ncbi:helix-turn-helix domain-containing protein [Kitasatospora sp. NPDC057223]|uniref:AlbA family DNA-binding domain-containing protein n=1 Tax=Kitasatospora sp. NPDC057223 TaxID=3346055 RepID=UPI003631AEE8
MVMRSRRLEDLLGGRLDALKYKDITDLVSNADAAEGEDLDYKQAHYATDDKGKEELAKDVAAFANHTGGLLILGMAESKGVPSKVMDVDLDDRHFRHIRQVIASNTAPPVSYEAIAVPNPDAPGRGFFLLAVPRSPLGPHAVTAPPTKPTREALRYPRRGGSGTDWLTETAVATAYRARFSAAAARDQRMTDVEEDLVDALADRTLPHLIVTLVPEVPGEMAVDSVRFARYESELRGTELYLGQGHRLFGDVAVGARRLIVEEGGGDRAARAELHRDGSAAIVLPLHRHLSKLHSDEPDWQFVEPGDVVYQLLCALPFLASHARDRAAATGTAQVKATLVDDMASHPCQRLKIDMYRPEPLPLTIDFLHRTAGHRVPASTQPCGFAYSEATVLLDDIADHGVGLLQATAALADELLHAYGLPDNQLITREGHLNTGLFTDRNRGAVARWAAQNPLISSAE